MKGDLLTLTALTKENFEEQVLRYKGLALVEFTKEWYGSSQIITLMLEKLASVYQERIKFCYLECDIHDPIAEKFYIQEFPTILVFRNGSVQDRIVGMISIRSLNERIDNLLETDTDS
jgi:thioredoxin 1